MIALENGTDFHCLCILSDDVRGSEPAGLIEVIVVQNDEHPDRRTVVNSVFISREAVRELAAKCGLISA